MSEHIWAAVLLAVLLVALGLSNTLFYLGVPFYVTRKVAHIGSAIPIVLLPVAFFSIAYPLLLSGLFVLVFASSHKYDLFPGFARKGRWSEIYFPLSVCVSIGLLWNYNPWWAIVPPLWLALGDGVTGLVRMKVNKREVKGWYGSLACWIVCLLVGVLTLSWAGVLGASVATLFERFSGDAEGAIIPLDDNLTMPLSGTLVLLLWQSL